jgi:hypothetical protein
MGCHTSSGRANKLPRVNKFLHMHVYFVFAVEIPSPVTEHLFSLHFIQFNFISATKLNTLPLLWHMKKGKH